MPQSALVPIQPNPRCTYTIRPRAHSRADHSLQGRRNDPRKCGISGPLRSAQKLDGRMMRTLAALWYREYLLIQDFALRFKPHLASESISHSPTCQPYAALLTRPTGTRLLRSIACECPRQWCIFPLPQPQLRIYSATAPALRCG
jgi:hypothetical protein